jgi:hypothetical protein
MTTHAGEIVELRDFGTFRLRYRQARVGRNPRMGDAVEIPVKTVPVFTAGKAFQELMAPATPAPCAPEEAVSPQPAAEAVHDLRAADAPAHGRPPMGGGAYTYCMVEA